MEYRVIVTPEEVNYAADLETKGIYLLLQIFYVYYLHIDRPN